jgi:hypothetical protein
MERSFLRLVAGTGTCLLLQIAPAGAQVGAVADGHPARTELSLPVTASVGGRCGFAGAAPSGIYTAQDLNAGFTHEFTFALRCNSPSRTAVVSANGGLLAPGGPVPAGYARFAGYSVTLGLVGNAGATPVSATCDAQALTPGASQPCVFRGPAAANQGLRLDAAASAAPGSFLRVSAAPYTGPSLLLASEAYADVLTVTLSAAL